MLPDIVKTQREDAGRVLDSPLFQRAEFTLLVGPQPADSSKCAASSVQHPGASHRPHHDAGH